MKDFCKINDLDSERFLEFFCFFCIFGGFGICFFLFNVDIFELLPLILSFDHESFDDISLSWHEFTKFYTFVFKNLNQFVNLELRECWNSVYNTFFLESRE